MAVNQSPKMPFWFSMLLAGAFVVGAFWIGSSQTASTRKASSATDEVATPKAPPLSKMTAQLRPEDAGLIVKEPGKTPPGMVWIPGGVTLIGNAEGEHEDERVEHEVALDGFWMDATEVTNRDF